MRTLILMRHAKSDWFSDAAVDFDRPLNSRGQGDAVRMGLWLRTMTRPNLIYCSSAERTRETLALLALQVPTEYRDQLYQASEYKLLSLVKLAPSNAESLMLIAHNPGIGRLANEFLETYCPDMEHFPAAACAILKLDIDDWANAELKEAKLESYMTPKTLPHRHLAHPKLVGLNS